MLSPAVPTAEDTAHLDVSFFFFFFFLLLNGGQEKTYCSSVLNALGRVWMVKDDPI